MNQIKVISEQEFHQETVDGILALRKLRIKMAHDCLNDLRGTAAKVRDYERTELEEVDSDLEYTEELQGQIKKQMEQRLIRYQNLQNDEFYQEEVELYLELMNDPN